MKILNVPKHIYVCSRWGMKPIIKVQVTRWGFATYIPCSNKDPINKWKLAIILAFGWVFELFLLISSSLEYTYNEEFQWLQMHLDQSFLAELDQISSWTTSLMTEKISEMERKDIK